MQLVVFESLNTLNFTQCEDYPRLSMDLGLHTVGIPGGILFEWDHYTIILSNWSRVT